MRIYATDPSDRPRLFEFREGQPINGAMFRGWSTGDWGNRGWNGGWEGEQAASNTGQYEIVSAQYGTSRHHVDVTNTLRQFVQTGQDFINGNNVFGIDPDPFQVKTLRVTVRDPNGRQRVVEYPEGAPVNAAQFGGPGEGNRGYNGYGHGPIAGNPGYGGYGSGDAGQYVILGAEYGTARNHVNVTTRLRQLARQDMSFRMGNSTFGFDPDPGHIKTLRIYARGPDGRERVFSYREGSTIDGATFRGWVRADWGNENWRGRWDRDNDDDNR